MRRRRGTEEVVRAADRNQVEAWRRMLVTSPGVREATFGSVRAILTGSPLDLFNPVFALDPVDDPEAELGAALRFVEAAGVPPLVYLHRGADRSLEGFLEARGLT